jgi:hypothetical protein
MGGFDSVLVVGLLPPDRFHLAPHQQSITCGSLPREIRTRFWKDSLLPAAADVRPLPLSTYNSAHPEQQYHACSEVARSLIVGAEAEQEHTVAAPPHERCVALLLPSMVAPPDHHDRTSTTTPPTYLLYISKPITNLIISALPAEPC